MRFSRSSRIASLIVFLSSVAAYAAPGLINIKNVQISEGSQVDLLLDGKISPSQIRTEFVNDIVQLSLSDVSVYPAKISSVSGGDLSKIFVYQYAPKLVRFRLTVKGKAENYQKRISVKTNGKILTVRILPAAGAEIAETKVANDKKNTASLDEVEEKALLERVLRAPIAALKGETKPEKADAKIEAKSENGSDHGGNDESKKSTRKSVSGKTQNSHQALAGGKPLPGLGKTFGMLALVIGLFGAVALGFRRLKAGTGSKALSSSVSRWVKSSMGKKEKMIEVVATHYLGPKKSIAMVRVAGQTLVLGVSDGAINLITQLSAETSNEANELSAAVDHDNFGAEGGSDDIFASFLQTESSRPARASQGSGATSIASGATSALRPNLINSNSGTSTVKTSSTSARSGVRSQIRSRMEAMKSL